MKLLLISLIFLASCSTQRNGCDYHGGKAPKFRACTGTLEKAELLTYNKVKLTIRTGDTALIVYHNFHYGIGTKRWPIGKQVEFLFDGSRAVVKI